MWKKLIALSRFAYLTENTCRDILQGSKDPSDNSLQNFNIISEW